MSKIVHGVLKKIFGSGGIRTHAIEMTGALNQRLRPLGHATNDTDHNTKTTDFVVVTMRAEALDHDNVHDTHTPKRISSLHFSKTALHPGQIVCLENLKRLAAVGFEPTPSK